MSYVFNPFTGNFDDIGNGGITFPDLASPPNGTALGASGTPFYTANLGTVAPVDGSAILSIVPSFPSEPGGYTAYAITDNHFTRTASGTTNADFFPANNIQGTLSGGDYLTGGDGIDLLHIDSIVTAGASAAYNLGIRLVAQTNPTCTVTTTTALYAEASVGGTSTDAYALNVVSLLGGTITNSRGIYIQSFVTAGDTTNQFGIDIADVVGGANNWAIRTGLGRVVFGDTVTATDFIVSGSAFKTDTTNGHQAFFQAYDVDGAAYKTFATLTNGNTPTFALSAPSGGTLSGDFTTLKIGGVNVGTGSGTVTSVAASVPAFLSIAGSPVTTSGTLAISYSGTALPVANGGTAATSAGISAFNNITGYSASGSTGTTSTNLVFSTSPSLVTPTLGVATATSITIGTTGTIDSSGNILTQQNLGVLNANITSNQYQIAIGAGSAGVYMAANWSVAWNSTNSGAMSVFSSGSKDTILGRGGAAATLQMGADVNGAAVNQIFQACNGITGTDKTGGNLTVASGKGTGAGAVSSLIFQTPTVLGSGTTAQSLATRLTLSSAGATFAAGITTIGGATFHTTSSALTDGAGVALGTLATAPSAGNPTKWIGINDNGTTRYIPAW